MKKWSRNIILIVFWSVTGGVITVIVLLIKYPKNTAITELSL